MKQRTVLAMLAVHAGRVVSVDRLVEALWEDHPPAAATATLQAYVSNLRRALRPTGSERTEDAVIVNRAGGYLLDVTDDQVDARRFGRLVEEAVGVAAADPAAARDLLAEGLALWKGPALAEFTYATFAAAEVARLEELRMIAFETRVEADLALGRAREVVPELEQMVLEHPLRERLWRHLALALSASGRQGEALRAIRRHASHLAEELGLPPSQAMRDLEETILMAGPADAAAPPAAAPPPGVGTSLEQIVGREAELERFAQALADARSGRGSVLLLEGEPGIGKTRLMEEMLAAAGREGFPAALARCVEVGGTPPFWPWIQASRGMMAILGVDELTEAAGPYAAVLAPFFPELRPRPGRPRTDPTIAPHVVAEGILHSMRILSRGRPIVMLIDDLYSADPDSLSVLTLLAAEIGSLGLVIVGSYRNISLPEHHPMARTLVEMSRMGRVDRLPLTGLTRDEVAALVESEGRQAEPAFVDALHARTGGNAYFTVELLRLLDPTAEAEAVLDQATVPGTVREVLRRRVSLLDDATVHLLRMAAVCGRRWEIDIVRDLTDQDLDTTLDALDEALASGLVVEDGNAGSYRFTHVLVADALAQELGGLRRSVVHQRVADALERLRPDDPTTLVDIAHHASAAVPTAGVEPAVTALRRAGLHALESSALELGEQLLRRRMELVTSLPAGPDRDHHEIDALLDLALVWTWREGYQSARADEAARRVLELAAQRGAHHEASDDDLEGILAAYQARVSRAIVSGSPNETLVLVHELDRLAELSGHPAARFSAGVNGLVWAVHAGHVDEALVRSAAADELLDLLDPGATGAVMLPLGLQSMLVTHRAFSSWGRWMAGDAEGARAALAEARDVAERIGHTFTRGFLCAVEALVAHMAGSADWVADVVTWARFDPTLAEFGLQPLWMQAGEAWARGVRDDPAAALPQLRRALDMLAEIGAGVTRTQYLGMAADLELRAGMDEGAQATLDEAIRLADAHGEQYWKPELLRLRAASLRRRGRSSDAARDLTAAAELAATLGIVPLAERVASDRTALTPPVES